MNELFLYFMGIKGGRVPTSRVTWWCMKGGIPIHYCIVIFCPSMTHERTNNELNEKEQHGLQTKIDFSGSALPTFSVKRCHLETCLSSIDEGCCSCWRHSRCRRRHSLQEVRWLNQKPTLPLKNHNPTDSVSSDTSDTSSESSYTQEDFETIFIPVNTNNWVGLDYCLIYSLL